MIKTTYVTLITIEGKINMSTFDYNTLNSLKDRMEEKFPMLVECYLEDGQGYIDTIKNQFPAGDLDSLIAAAHNLKSASGLLGAIKVHEVAGKLEYSGKAMLVAKDEEDVENIERLLPLYDSVYRAFAEAQEVLVSID